MLQAACAEANAVSYEYSQFDEAYKGMGTTIVGGVINESGNGYIINVGDSRAYHISRRTNSIYQITRDHSLVEELVEFGAITKEQAKSHPQRNVITRAVGTEEGVEIDLLCEERRAGDVWLVCSDGLYGMVGDDAIASALSSLPMDKAADRLLSSALEAGGRDNISFIILLDKEGAQ